MARKAISNDRYRLVGTYERLRKSLLSQPDDGRLDKSLSYWVLPTDRRLPIAFLDRTLRDLLGAAARRIDGDARRRPEEGARLLRSLEAGLEGHVARCAVRHGPGGSEAGQDRVADRRLRRHDRFRSAVDQLVRDGESLRPGSREARPPRAFAAVAADRDLAYAAGRLFRPLARGDSPAQDARREARERGARDFLHGSRSAGHRHAPGEHRRGDRAAVPAAAGPLAQRSDSPARVARASTSCTSTSSGR